MTKTKQEEHAPLARSQKLRKPLYFWASIRPVGVVHLCFHLARTKSPCRPPVEPVLESFPEAGLFTREPLLNPGRLGKTVAGKDKTARHFPQAIYLQGFRSRK